MLQEEPAVQKEGLDLGSGTTLVAGFRGEMSIL
jgi:hypothetical protein